MSFHDPQKHLEYLRQALSQDRKPIGFFLAAGCPLAVSMPDDEWPLIPDVASLTTWINSELGSNPEYSKLLEELGKSGKNPKNVEDILSFTRGLVQVAVGGEVRGLSEMQLKTLEKLICDKIVEKIDVSLPERPTPYHEVAKWISSIDREVPVEIFTTNYDLLMECALEQLEVPYFDGFVGSRKSFFDLRALEGNLIPKHWTRFWKIHGSINWYQEDLGGTKRVVRSSIVNNGKSHLIYPSHLKYEQSRKMPYLALIDQLGRFIRQKQATLIISGYSFSDEHLNDTIVNALKANPSGSVLSLLYGTYLDDGGNERYPKAYKLASERHNLSVWTFDKSIIGTNIGIWRATKPVEDPELESFIQKNPNADPMKGGNDRLIQLGNFDVFSKFLKTLIGKKFESSKVPQL